MKQMEQQEFMKQMDMANERLRNAGVRIEIVQDFAIFFRKKIEELWVDVSTYVDDLHEKHNLTTEEMLLMCIQIEHNIKEINLPGQI